MYKAGKDQVSVFGLRTQFGGGKTTGFALVYDSPEAMKKFEPHYRLVRVGLATKIEKASRQQRECLPCPDNEQPRLVGDGIGSALGPIPYDKKHTSTDHITPKQASSARTARRPSAEPPRSRVPSPRRRNRRLARDGPVASFTILHGWWDELRLCALLYDNALWVPADVRDDILEFHPSAREGVTAGLWLRSITIQDVCFPRSPICSLCRGYNVNASRTDSRLEPLPYSHPHVSWYN